MVRIKSEDFESYFENFRKTLANILEWLLRPVAPGAGCQVAVAAWGGNSFSELNKYNSPRWKCYFRNGIMVIRYCKDSRLGQFLIGVKGKGYQMKLAVQKKGEFLNTSCTLAKTLQGFEDWSELILLSGRETQFKTNMLFPLHSLREPVIYVLAEFVR